MLIMREFFSLQCGGNVYVLGVGHEEEGLYGGVDLIKLEILIEKQFQKINTFQINH